MSLLLVWITMGCMALGSFPLPSSASTVGSWWRTQNCATSYCSSSSKTKASWYKTEKIQNKYHIMRHHHNHYRGIEVGSTFHQRARSYVVNAGSGETFESAKPQHFQKPFRGSIIYYLDAFRRFFNMHALIGLAVSIASMSFLAVEHLSDISLPFFIGLFQAEVAAILMSAYNTAINHLTDIEIDKINKPYRPLASGEFSYGTGLIITASCLILSFGIGWIVGSPPLLWALSFLFVMSTAYSIDLPLMRWKSNAVLAAGCIVVVRGIVYQLAYFFHMQTFVFKRPTVVPRSLIFSTAFLSFFNLVLAMFKVFWICVSLLEMMYGVAIVVCATISSNHWSRMITVSAHAVFALVLWYRAKTVDVKSSSATESFYMFLWKLLYAEYLIIPFMR